MDFLSNNDESTAGARPSEYLPARTEPTAPTRVENNGGGGGWFPNILHVAPALSGLEKIAPFTFTFIAIVGYIVIASFGGIEKIGQFLGYGFFLLISIFLYSVSKIENKLFVYKIIIGLLLLLLTATNWGVIKPLPYIVMEKINNELNQQSLVAPENDVQTQ